RRARAGLAAALPLDQRDHRARGSRVPARRRHEEDTRRGAPRGVRLLQRDGGAPPPRSRRRHRDRGGERRSRWARAAPDRAALLPVPARGGRQRDDAQRDDRRHARVHPERGRVEAAAGERGTRDSRDRGDLTLRGQTIRAGQSLCLFYPSANRDEEIFPDGEVFRIDRQPNDHVGFGRGEHVCLGAHLARLEIRCVFEELRTRLVRAEHAGPVDRVRSSFVGGIKRAPLRWEVAPAR
ncbi:MAG: cytochrome P450, partial [Deltaproteobacteria bacterium]